MKAVILTAFNAVSDDKAVYMTTNPFYSIPVQTHYSTLTHWGRVTHICVGKLTSIGSDNGLSPGRRQAIIWTNAAILLIGPLGTNFRDILIEMQTFSLKKICLKMSSAKYRSFCLCLDVLMVWSYGIYYHINGPVQDCGNSSVIAMELPQFVPSHLYIFHTRTALSRGRTKPLYYCLYLCHVILIHKTNHIKIISMICNKSSYCPQER